MFKIKTGWSHHSFVWKTKRERKQKAGTCSHGGIISEFPTGLFWRFSFQPRHTFVGNNESYQEKSMVIFTLEFHPDSLGTVALFYSIMIAAIIRFYIIIFSGTMKSSGL